jgi:hypothetical protein
MDCIDYIVSIGLIGLKNFADAIARIRVRFSCYSMPNPTRSVSNPDDFTELPLLEQVERSNASGDAVDRHWAERPSS